MPMSDETLTGVVELLTGLLSFATKELNDRKCSKHGNVRKTANRLGWHVRIREGYHGAYGYGPYVELRPAKSLNIPSQNFRDFDEVELFLKEQANDIRQDTGVFPPVTALRAANGRFN